MDRVDNVGKVDKVEKVDKAKKVTRECDRNKFCWRQSSADGRADGHVLIAQDGLTRNKDGLMSMPDSLSFCI